MSAAVILLAAGHGQRLGWDRPKAFVEVAGRPLLARAAETAVAAAVTEALIVVAPAGWEAEAERAVAGCGLPVRVVPGGLSRQDSVRLALGAISEDDVVVCHDVARPLAVARLFRDVVGALAEADGAVPVVPVTDTVKRVTDGLVSETLRRDELALAQTPQAFLRQPLIRSHARAVAAPAPPLATDDAALLEAAGYRVAVVPGDPMNVKVTVPGDIAVVEALLGADG